MFPTRINSVWEYSRVPSGRGRQERCDWLEEREKRVWGELGYEMDFFDLDLTPRFTKDDMDDGDYLSIYKPKVLYSPGRSLLRLQ